MMRSFREELCERRPDLAVHLEENGDRLSIARILRAARRRAGLTRNQLAEASGMTRTLISSIEAPTGPEPALRSIERYMRACGE